MPACAIAPRPRRIALLTDFGTGPYVGQMRLRLAAMAPATPVVSLVDDLPAFRPDLAAGLLPGLLRGMPGGTVYLCVVDPGVGGERAILIAHAGRDWVLAPDNGLLLPWLRQRPAALVRRLDWRPPCPSASFHGRDIFAPVAAALVRGRLPAATPVPVASLVGAGQTAERAMICYVDRYGNLITGLAAAGRDLAQPLRAAGCTLFGARTFCAVPPGTVFWYCNAFGLVEIAVNQGSAAARLGLGPGDPVAFG